MPKHIAPEAFVHTRDIAVLRHREWWTPMQAAIVLGRGEEFWRIAAVQGHCKGSIEGTEKRNTYKINAESARAYAANIAKSRREEPKSIATKLVAAWRARRKKERELHTETVAGR